MQQDPHPVVYVDDDVDVSDFPDNYKVVYRKFGYTLDEDGNLVESTEISSQSFTETAAAEDESDGVEEQETVTFKSPKIIAETFTTTVHELSDGSISVDVEFEIEPVEGATSYEVRYL